MRRVFLLGCLLLPALVLPAAPAAQEEGDIVSRSQLVKDIPADAEHPVRRKVMQAQEEEVSCQPAPKKILAVHYRAQPTAEFSMNDDRIVIAAEQGDQEKILKVLESEADVINNKLYSGDDFEQDFITIRGMRFLYVRQRISGSAGAVMHDAYSLSSDDKIFAIPFEDLKKSKLLNAGEELRNGSYRFENEGFTFEAGIYQPHDPECCPSNGSYHARFVLAGECRQNPATQVVEPGFRFVIQKEWRSGGDEGVSQPPKP